jgi:hypothetical protein
VSKAAGNGSTAAAEPRGVLILPGLANNSADYAGLSQHLHDRGLSTRVVQVCPPIHTIECFEHTCSSSSGTQMNTFDYAAACTTWRLCAIKITVHSIQHQQQSCGSW